MYFDDKNKNSWSQKITTTADSTDTITMPKAAQYSNAKIPYVILVNEDFNGGGTLDIDMQLSASGQFDDTVTFPILKNMAKANLKANPLKNGVIWQGVIPSNGTAFSKMKIRYTVNTTSFTAGKITAAVYQES